LKTLAKEKYKSAVSTAWNYSSFISSLKLLYAETPESDRLLKDVAIQAAADHVEELVKSSDFVGLCQANGEIGIDVLKACYLPSAPQATPSASTGWPEQCRRCGDSAYFKAVAGVWVCGNSWRRARIT